MEFIHDQRSDPHPGGRVTNAPSGNLRTFHCETECSFFQLEAQRAMERYDEAPSGVAKELALLVRQALLDRVPSESRVSYVRREHPLWAVFDAPAVAFDLGRPPDRQLMARLLPPSDPSRS